MAISVTKKFEFEACHNLNDYDGPCSRMHGHTYKLEVTIELPKYTSLRNGMIIDFSDLKSIVNEKVISVMDHQNLNTITDNSDDLIFEQPTAENMVLWIADELKPVFARMSLHLAHIRLYETSNSHADWHNDM